MTKMVKRTRAEQLADAKRPDELDKLTRLLAENARLRLERDQQHQRILHLEAITEYVPNYRRLQVDAEQKAREADE